MPKRNAIRQYAEQSYYHVYNRGVAKMKLFRDPDDYQFFVSLLQRYVSPETTRDSSRRTRKNFSEEIEIIAYCLMPNHFHLFVYLKQEKGLAHLMQSAMTAYSMYFNKKYDRVGGVFEGRFLASRVTSEPYFWHVSRYIHLNPIDATGNYRDYPYSSVKYFITSQRTDWVKPEHVMPRGGEAKYARFLQDYEALHDLYAQLKHQLAHE